MKNITLAILILLFLFSCNQQVERPAVNLVPYPNQLQEKEGTFSITPRTAISTNTEDAIRVAELLGVFIEEKLSVSPTISEGHNPIKANSIHLAVRGGPGFIKRRV